MLRISVSTTLSSIACAIVILLYASGFIAIKKHHQPFVIFMEILER
jgi:hypothetical protein